MSGICGIFRRDGGPPDPGVLNAMLDRGRHRGPDGRSLRIDGRVALGHLLLATTPESVGECQPLVHEGPELVIVFDGRIDNREELRPRLGAGGWTPRVGTDAEFALRAYELWRQDSADRLIGDFAFAVWDRRDRSLYCARDVSGVRPFHYHAGDEVFVFGTDLAQVLAHPAVPRGVNEGMVAEHLACRIATQGETLYEDVRRLPPAHWIRVRERGLTIRRYWALEPGPPARHRRLADHVERYQEVLRRAVRDRLRVAGPTGIYLSGGLDSTTVAGLAADLVRCGAVETELAAFSIVLPGHPGDETDGIRCVTDHWALESHLSAFTTYEPPDFDEQVRATGEPPEFPTVTMTRDLRQRAHERGIRVLLTGTGAHRSVGGTAFPYPDLVRQGAVRRILRELRFQAERAGWSDAVRTLALTMLWPVVPASVARTLDRRRLGRLPLPLIEPAFARRVGLVDRLLVGGGGRKLARRSQEEMRRWATDGGTVLVLEAGDRADARDTQEQRHPFLDRRVVEAGARIPDAAKREAAEDKRLLRRAGPRILPREIARRSWTGNYNVCFERAFAMPAVRRSLERLTIAERGWVDPRRVAQARRAWEPGAGVPTGPRVPPAVLWMPFALERWSLGSGGTEVC